MSIQKKTEYTHTCDLCKSAVTSSSVALPDGWALFGLTPDAEDREDVCQACATAIYAVIEARRA